MKEGINTCSIKEIILITVDVPLLKEIINHFFPDVNTRKDMPDGLKNHVRHVIIFVSGALGCKTSC